MVALSTSACTQGLSFALVDSIVMPHYQRIAPWRPDLYGCTDQPYRAILMSRGYYMLQDSLNVLKGYLVHYPTGRSWSFRYGEVGKVGVRIFDFRSFAYASHLQPVNRWRLADLLATDEKVYLLFVELENSHPQGYLCEFDLRTETWHTTRLQDRLLDNYWYERLGLVRDKLWVWGWSKYGYEAEKGRKWCFCEVASQACYAHKLPYFSDYEAYSFIALHYTDPKSDLIFDGYYPIGYAAVPTTYFYDIRHQAVTFTLTNPHQGLLSAGRLRRGELMTMNDFECETSGYCGDMDSGGVVWNSFYYSGYRTFRIDRLYFLYQQALEPLCLNKEIWAAWQAHLTDSTTVKKERFYDFIGHRAPLRWHLTVWNDSLQVVADLPWPGKLLDISEVGAFTVRYRNGDAIIYRHRIEVVEP